MITDLPETYTDENGNVRVYTVADRLDDEDPEWRTDFSNVFFNWLRSDSRKPTTLVVGVCQK
jgi:hypothetical protein